MGTKASATNKSRKRSREEDHDQPERLGVSRPWLRIVEAVILSRSALAENHCRIVPRDTWDKLNTLMGLPRYILPKDLPDALSQLDAEELARLLAAALAETKRRDRASPQEDKSSRPSGEDISLPRGKINAVRAAARAGFSPSRIARQFGISLAEVRKITAMANR